MPRRSRAIAGGKSARARWARPGEPLARPRPSPARREQVGRAPASIALAQQAIEAGGRRGHRSRWPRRALSIRRSQYLAASFLQRLGRLIEPLGDFAAQPRQPLGRGLAACQRAGRDARAPRRPRHPPGACQPRRPAAAGVSPVASASSAARRAAPRRSRQRVLRASASVSPAIADRAPSPARRSRRQACPGRSRNGKHRGGMFGGAASPSLAATTHPPPRRSPTAVPAARFGVACEAVERSAWRASPLSLIGARQQPASCTRRLQRGAREVPGVGQCSSSERSASLARSAGPSSTSSRPRRPRLVSPVARKATCCRRRPGRGASSASAACGPRGRRSSRPPSAPRPWRRARHWLHRGCVCSRRGRRLACSPGWSRAPPRWPRRICCFQLAGRGDCQAARSCSAADRRIGRSRPGEIRPSATAGRRDQPGSGPLAASKWYLSSASSLPRPWSTQPVPLARRRASMRAARADDRRRAGVAATSGRSACAVVAAARSFSTQPAPLPGSGGRPAAAAQRLIAAHCRRTRPRSPPRTPGGTVICDSIGVGQVDAWPPRIGRQDPSRAPRPRPAGGRGPASWPRVPLRRRRRPRAAAQPASDARPQWCRHRRRPFPALDPRRQPRLATRWQLGATQAIAQRRHDGALQGAALRRAVRPSLARNRALTVGEIAALAIDRGGAFARLAGGAGPPGHLLQPGDFGDLAEARPRQASRACCAAAACSRPFARRRRHAANATHARSSSSRAERGVGLGEVTRLGARDRRRAARGTPLKASARAATDLRH